MRADATMWSYLQRASHFQTGILESEDEPTKLNQTETRPARVIYVLNMNTLVFLVALVSQKPMIGFILLSVLGAITLIKSQSLVSGKLFVNLEPGAGTATEATPDST